MTIKQALAWVTKKLQAKNIKNASLDAEVLLSFILIKPKEFLYTYPEKVLTSGQTRRLNSLVKRRAKGEPIAYLTNHKEFYGLDFYVDKRVLIPRPKTELLIDEVLNYINQPRSRGIHPRRAARINSSPTRREIKIADIGTGSGCIAVALKKHLPKSEVYATDISKSALVVAKKNARRHKVKIKFFQGDLLKPLITRRRNVDVSPSLPRIDIIVANLPYLDNALNRRRHWPMSPAALRYEPRKALAGGKYGLEIYEKFFKQIQASLIKPKIIFCEIGNNYQRQLQQLLKKYSLSSQIEIKKDLASLNRILKIVKGPAS